MKNEKDMENKIKTGLYKHYKNNKMYQVLSTGKNEETQEDVVIYQAKYGDEKIWVRPEKKFLEIVEVEGIKKPRFEFISGIEDEDKKSFEDKYKRALADYHNLVKQAAGEKTEFAKYATEQFLHQILPVYDNLKMVVAHSDPKNHDSWFEGVKHVVNQFKSILENNGVEEIKTVGESFDHNYMEAVSNEETDDEEKDGMVAKEVKAGYVLHGKVIVPARVMVYKYKG